LEIFSKLINIDWKQKIVEKEHKIELKGSKKINLKHGETKMVSFKVKPSQLKYYDAKMIL
jgi:hypothetical protein